jgi:acetolactate synthase-1/2/3 large subunit
MTVDPVEWLAEQLVKRGLRAAFGVTGSGASWKLLSALEGHGCVYYPVAHEASGAIMAGVFTKLTGSLALSLSVKGPGLASMFPGIVYNHFENHPAISVSECFGSEVPSHRKHKRLDHAAILKPVVKASAHVSLEAPELTHLLEIARREVPGPVHIHLCRGEHGKIAPGPKASPGAPSASPDPGNLLEILRHANSPVVIVGSLATRRAWGQSLTGLNCPVLTTASAKGAIDEALPQAAGVFTGDGKELSPEVQVLGKSDLIVGLGLRNSEVLTARPFGRRAVLVDEVDLRLGDGFDADLVEASADSALFEGVITELSRSNWGLEAVAAGRAALRAELLRHPWLPAQCFEVLNGLSHPCALVVDTGSFCTIAEHMWEASSRRAFLGSSNGRFMGTAIPAALGASMARPGVPVLCVVGDGGVRDYLVELKLAVEEMLPVCVILMSDGRFGSVAGPSPEKGLSRRAIEVHAPSWLRAVQGMGVDARAVASNDDLSRELQAWNRRGPLFLEAVFDPAAYAAMTSRVR